MDNTGIENDDEADGTVAHARRQRKGRKDVGLLPSDGQGSDGLRTGGLCDDGPQNEIQERRSKSTLQDFLPDAEIRHADADVRRTHEVYDTQIRTKKGKNKGKKVKK